MEMKSIFSRFNQFRSVHMGFCIILVLVVIHYTHAMPVTGDNDIPLIDKATAVTDSRNPDTVQLVGAMPRPDTETVIVGGGRAISGTSSGDADQNSGNTEETNSVEPTARILVNITKRSGRFWEPWELNQRGRMASVKKFDTSDICPPSICTSSEENLPRGTGGSIFYNGDIVLDLEAADMIYGGTSLSYRRRPKRATTRSRNRLWPGGIVPYVFSKDICAEMAYAFVDYEDRRDAEDAVRYENGREIAGGAIIVEWAKGSPRRQMDRRDGRSRIDCYRCGRTGHLARECPDVGNYGYRRRRSRSRSRSRSRDRRRRSRSRSRRKRSRSRSRDRRRRSRTRSRSRSRSPSRSKSRSKDREARTNGQDDKSKSKSRSRSPARDKSASPS